MKNYRTLTPDQLLRFEPDETGRRLVGKQDLLIVDQHDLGKRAREVREETITPLDFLVALTEGVEQAVDGMRNDRRVRIRRYR